MTRVSIPRRFAVAMPPASERFEITITMRAFAIFPNATFFAIASKFDTRPDNNIPSCFMPLQTSRVAVGGQICASSLSRLHLFSRPFKVKTPCPGPIHAHYFDGLHNLFVLERGLRPAVARPQSDQRFTAAECFTTTGRV